MEYDLKKNIPNAYHSHKYFIFILLRVVYNQFLTLEITYLI